MKYKTTMLAALVMGCVSLAGAQQVNVVFNNQWPAAYGEVRQLPHIVFQSSFQTQRGQGFATPWLGHDPFCLTIGENPSVFSTDAQVVTPEDVEHNRQGTMLFSLPRNMPTAAKIMNASGWRFSYGLGGYHVTLLIESIWLDPSQIVRCKGHVVATADEAVLSSENSEPGLTDSHVEQLERLAALRDRGVLTEDEFAREKERILNAR